jgi:CheY-like chemotaxis protein
MASEAHSVLVVDDEDDIREAVVLILESKGYTACGAEHGAQALAQLRAGFRPCLILLDLMMPVMDGWTFCQETSKDPALAKLPIVVVSAVQTADARQGTERAVERLGKPLDVRKLLRTVERHC